VISNPYGVEERQYLMGAPVELAIPVSVVPQHQTLNITASTYVDAVNFTFIAMRHALPDVQKIADYTALALDELERDLARQAGKEGRAARAVKKPARAGSAGPRRQGRPVRAGARAGRDA
jgi:hypothetical protein